MILRCSENVGGISLADERRREKGVFASPTILVLGDHFSCLCEVASALLPLVNGWADELVGKGTCISF